MTKNTECIQPFENLDPLSGNILNPSPLDNSNSGNGSNVLPEYTTTLQALENLERNITCQPNDIFKLRPTLEKIGIVSSQLPTAVKVKAEMHKVSKDINGVTKKLMDVEKTFAEWIDVFQSVEVSHFGVEFEKFLKEHYKLNKILGDQLDLISTALKSIIEVEIRRNCDLVRYLKCKKEREEFKQKSTDLITLFKHDDKVDHAYAALLSSHNGCERNIRRILKPALFSYASAMKTGANSIQELVRRTSLDIKGYEKIVSHKDPVFEYHKNFSELGVNFGKNSNDEYITDDDLYIPTEFNPTDKEIIYGKESTKYAVDVATGDVEANSDFYLEDSKAMQNEFLKHPQDYKIKRDSNNEVYKGSYANKINPHYEMDYSTIEQAKKERSPFSQRGVPNEANNFDSTDNYTSYVHAERKKTSNKPSQYYDSADEDTSNKVWKS